MIAELLWPIVALVLIAVANYRLGQYLNPPLLERLRDAELRIEETYKDLHKTTGEAFLRQEKIITEMRTKLNSLMVDKGFSK